MQAEIIIFILTCLAVATGLVLVTYCLTRARWCTRLMTLCIAERIAAKGMTKAEAEAQTRLDAIRGGRPHLGRWRTRRASKRASASSPAPISQSPQPKGGVGVSVVGVLSAAGCGCASWTARAGITFCCIRRPATKTRLGLMRYWSACSAGAPAAGREL